MFVLLTPLPNVDAPPTDVSAVFVDVTVPESMTTCMFRVRTSSTDRTCGSAIAYVGGSGIKLDIFKFRHRFSQSQLFNFSSGFYTN